MSASGLEKPTQRRRTPPPRQALFLSVFFLPVGGARDNGVFPGRTLLLAQRDLGPGRLPRRLEARERRPLSPDVSRGIPDAVRSALLPPEGGPRSTMMRHHGHLCKAHHQGHPASVAESLSGGGGGAGRSGRGGRTQRSRTPRPSVHSFNRYFVSLSSSPSRGGWPPPQGGGWTSGASAASGRGAGIHGVRGASGDVRVLGPGFPPDLRL